MWSAMKIVGNCFSLYIKVTFTQMPLSLKTGYKHTPEIKMSSCVILKKKWMIQTCNSILNTVYITKNNHCAIIISLQ